jgi:NAD(P)-dependent dehydrogenase (short-subunit alcohol dehydrogenase family)
MGRACAQRLATQVDTLVLIDRDPDGLSDAAEALSAVTNVISADLDVTEADAVHALAGEIGAMGSLRGVAHAAGISPTMADWRRILHVDLVGSAILIDALTPFVRPGTAAVCFASMASQLMLATGDPVVDPILDDPLDYEFLDRMRAAVGDNLEDTGFAYSWAKRGVQRLVRREALRWGPLGGRICSISPGMINTPQGRQEAESQPAMATMLEITPLQREGESIEIAAVVAFLVSDEASFMTGCDVLVDGGVCAAVEAMTRAG